MRKKYGSRREIEVQFNDELGEVENWPAGFLQEATEERMALLEERARKAEASE